MSNVNKIQLEEMRGRMKTLLAFYLVCLAVLAFVCVLMYHTTSYYAAAYPYSNITALPRNFTTLALSMLNGYTEKVPANANLTTITGSISSIRHNAETSVSSTIIELALAMTMMMFFGILGAITDGKAEKAGSSRKSYYLPAMFLASLLLSQYAIVAGVSLRHGTLSGTSLFFIDALAMVIWFGILAELRMFRFLEPAARLPMAFGGLRNAVKVLIVALPVILVLITLQLTVNLGLFSYIPSFAGTYVAHTAGLFGFILMFTLLFYRDRLPSFVSSGSRLGR
jgi:hypothetical protein